MSNEKYKKLCNLQAICESLSLKNSVKLSYIIERGEIINACIMLLEIIKNLENRINNTEILNDVLILADTIIENWKEYDDGDYSPEGYRCKFCSKSSWHGYLAITHELDCPVLVAKDILTATKKDKK